MHFQQMLRETNTKSKKFSIRWSKVPRVLEPLNRVMAFLVTRLATAVSSRKTPKLAINRNFRGLRAFSANVAGTKTKSKKLRIRWSKVPRVLEPLNSSYGHFSHPVGHGLFKPKNTQTGNKSQFPGATCIFSKCCERQKRRAGNSASDGQKYRAFWSP